MKTTFFFALFLFSFSSFAQQRNDYMMLFEKIDSLVDNYIQFSKLTSFKSKTVLQKNKDDLISLFTTDSSPVDYDATHFKKHKIDTNTCTRMSIKEYCNKIQLKYPDGLSIRILKADIDYSKLDELQVSVMLNKEIARTKRTKNKESYDKPQIFIDTCTILLFLKISENFIRVKIDSIQIISPNIRKRVSYLIEEDKPNVNIVELFKERKLYGNFAITNGTISQDEGYNNFLKNYKSIILTKSTYSQIKYDNGRTNGLIAQLEYYFGHTNQFGIGTGILYARENGNLQVTNFHVEYKALDSKNEVFRQVINSDKAITEKITTTNLTLPFVLKFRKDWKNKFGFLMEAGVLINLYLSNIYKTNAVFDYNAIYSYIPMGNNINGSHYGYKTVYDSNTTPIMTDLVINGHNYTGSQIDEFASYGFNVGLNKAPLEGNGTVVYKSSSIGFFCQPSFTYAISDKMFMSLGCYLFNQKFSNNAGGFLLTDKIGSYTSLSKSVSTIKAFNIGLNLGIHLMIK